MLPEQRRNDSKASQARNTPKKDRTKSRLDQHKIFEETTMLTPSLDKLSVTYRFIGAFVLYV